ncbi:MAG: hypothetical protein WCN92_07545 [Eubacteriales bacterium]
MLEGLGELLGSMIVILYVLTILNFFVKFIFKNYRKQLSKYPEVLKIYTIIMKLIVKNHKLFGLLTILFIIAHFLLQFSQYGLNIVGTIAAGAMTMQIMHGIYGSKMKKRSKIWLISHRTLAAVLLIAIAIHTA